MTFYIKYLLIFETIAIVAAYAIKRCGIEMLWQVNLKFLFMYMPGLSILLNIFLQKNIQKCNEI